MKLCMSSAALGSLKLIKLNGHAKTVENELAILPERPIPTKPEEVDELFMSEWIQ
jgi:hypothetical protein